MNGLEYATVIYVNPTAPCIASGRMATVASVNKDRTVNLAVLMPSGAWSAEENVEFVKAGAKPSSPYIPYCKEIV